MAFPTQSIDLESGSAQYANIASGSQTGLNFSDQMTLEGWVKFESTGTRGLVGRFNAAAGSNRAYFFRLQDANTLHFRWIQDNAGTNGGSVTVAWTPSTATWYHVAVTKNGTSVKFYVDGSQQGTTQTGAASTIYDATINVVVGATESDGAEPFDGRMVAWRAWNVERTQTEINNNKCFLLGPTTGLAAEWGFNNAYTDASGNSNTLSGVNSPTFGADVPVVCAVTGPANVKTFDGIAQSTGVKTYMGVAVADTKTVIGVN